MAVKARYTDKPISVNFDLGDADEIRRVAERDEVSINAVIRFLVGTDNSLGDLSRGRVRVSAE